MTFWNGCQISSDSLPIISGPPNAKLRVVKKKPASDFAGGISCFEGERCRDGLPFRPLFEVKAMG